MMASTGKEVRMIVAERWTTLTREKLLWIYERMSLIREFEERLKFLIESGLPIGAAHYYSGEEAVAVGVCAALAPTDWIASTHRGHGHCIAKEVDVRAMMAELYGKATGTNRGKGGSMHLTDITKGMLGVNPILGMGTPHALGAAWSARVRKTDQIAATFFGDGAASIGVVHESMNMAAIWKLPVIFVCENNGYAQSTPVEYAISVKDLAVRGQGYNMPGVVVDGQDVFAVWGATDVAARRARAGEGPSLIECKTYRYYGHSAGDDPRRYRPAEEEEAARARDCIKRFRAQTAAEGIFTADELDAVDAQNKALLDEAVKFAEESPLPDPAELFTDVYVTEN
jgi:pyruvate dehydrogenase E1 component alpha subunit